VILRNRALLAVLLAVAPGAARALDVQSGNYVFTIVHQEHGEIGEHQVAISRRGEDLVIEQAAEMEVTVPLLGGHRREGHSREVWRNQRLISFHGRTTENGEMSEVVAEAEGDLLVIQGSAGRFEAPAEAVPNQPLLHATAERTLLFDIETGEVHETEVIAHGVERLTVADGTVDGVRYELTNPRQDVWYDDTGIWVQWRLLEGGNGILTLTRRAVEPAAAP
jgi:hypothetical protein